jgi:mRNA-degrading endonuclease RelE of RelBE toxin-antitoxin system
MTEWNLTLKNNKWGLKITQKCVDKLKKLNWRNRDQLTKKSRQKTGIFIKTMRQWSYWKMMKEND